MLLRFVNSRPVSAITIQFLERGCERLQEMGKRRTLTIQELADRICATFDCAREDYLSISESVA